MLHRAKSLGLSPEKLHLLDRFLQRDYIDSGRLPCAVTLVARRGEVAHLSVLGRMDMERARPVTEDTIFRIYSMTKPLTSVAFMMLVEEGLVALDDPVHKFIPEWKDLGVYAGGSLQTGFQTRPPARPMLMVDLLRHTAGLTYGFQFRSNVDAAYRAMGIGEIGSTVTLDAMIEGLGQLPLEFTPGEAWNYSVATDVLGYLVGKISGMPFEDFLQARILDPLGMVDTGFHVPPEKADRLAACYNATPNGLVLQDDPATSPYLAPPSLVSGGGGLVSTVADYLRFTRAMMNGGLGDVRLVSPKTIALMTANHLPGGAELPMLSRSLFSEAAYDGVGFGLGFATTLNPAKALIPGTAGDYFWGGAASTFFWVDPREELICIFMTQVIPSSAYPVRRQLRTLVYSAFTD